MLRLILALFAAGHFPRFMAADDGANATAGGGGKNAPNPQPGQPGQIGSGAAQPNPDRNAQLRNQARQTRRTLLSKAEEKARNLSAATGTMVLPEAVATEDELYNALLNGDTAAHDTPPHLASGPNVGTVDLRPGETMHGPATGTLATGGIVPEHQILHTGVTPTLNAPGVGADTGLKLTPDNPDARAGAGGHTDGVDPADPGTQGARPVAPERHDNPDDTAGRVAASKELEATMARGELPTRDQFIASGCPEGELDNAIASAQRELDLRKGGGELVQENRQAAAAAGGVTTGGTATASSPPGVIGSNGDPGEPGEDGGGDLDAQALIDANTKEQLLALAEKEGVEGVKQGDTKETIANAIVAKRSAK